jgi:hypothetical protein
MRSGAELTQAQFFAADRKKSSIAAVPVNKVISAGSHLRRPANDGRIGWEDQRAIRGPPTGRAATALPRAYRVAPSGRRSEKLNNGGKFRVFDRDSQFYRHIQPSDEDLDELFE